jgi:integrase
MPNGHVPHCVPLVLTLRSIVGVASIRPHRKSAGRVTAWRVTVDGPRGADGRRRRLVRVVEGPKKEAREAAARLTLEAGRLPPRTGSVGQILDTWLQLADLAPRSREVAAWYTNHYLRPRIGDLPASKLTTLRLDRLYRELLESGGKDGTPLSPATVGNAHRILHRACGAAVTWGLLAWNPASGARPPKAAPRPARAPSPEAVREVIAAARAHDPEFASYLILAAATGARRGELCGLRWDDLDGGALTIRRSISAVGGDRIVKSTKSGRERTIPLGAGTLAELEQHRARVAEHAAKFDTTVGGYLFSNEPNGSVPWHPGRVTNRFVELRRHHRRDFRLHDLRHFAGTQMIGAGVPVTTAARRLGHARPSTTTDLYGEALDERDQAAADTLEALLAD